jgi:predicted DNA-binding ribbon-helix-helix protein
MKLRRPLKRAIILDGRKTSVTVEDGFWNGLKEIAAAQKTSISQLILKIDSGRKSNNRSSEIRLFVLDHYRRKAPQTEVHQK